MRDGQPGLVHDAVAVDEEVEVDRARAEAPLLVPNSAELPFDREQAGQELAGRELGLDHRRAVQEERLIRIADGLGLA